MNNEKHPILMMVPKEVLDELRANLNKLTNTQGSSTQGGEGIGDYISEKEAINLLGRKTTWFWMMRTKGLLAYTKVGNKVFYAKKDIQAMLDNHKQEAYAKSKRR